MKKKILLVAFISAVLSFISLGVVLAEKPIHPDFGGWYINLYGSGLSATLHQGPNCDILNGSCTGPAESVARWVCHGNTSNAPQHPGECRNTQTESWLTTQTLASPGCNKTVQLDVYNHNCRDQGLDQWTCGDADLLDYIVWYSGACATGPAFTTIAGAITDNFGQPLNQVSVEVQRGDGQKQTVLTGADGKFQITGFILTTDSYAVRAPAVPHTLANITYTSRSPTDNYENQNTPGNTSCGPNCNFIYTAQRSTILEVNCSVDPTSANKDQNVIWTANTTDGTPQFTYAWNFGKDYSCVTPTSNCNAAKNPTVKYSTAGTRNGSVSVTDNSTPPQTVTSTNTCSVTISPASTITLSATAQCNGTISQVYLSWNSLPGTTQYQIYRKIGTSAFSLLKTTTLTDYYDTNVTTGTQYSYYVNVPGSTVQSNTVPVTALNCQGSTSTSSVNVTSSASCVGTNLQNITLTWNDIQNPNFKSYKPYLTTGVSGQDSTGVCIPETSQLNHTFTNKTTLRNYQATVLTYYDTGCIQAAGNPPLVSVTNEFCPAPTSFIFSLSNSGNKTVTKTGSTAIATNPITITRTSGNPQTVNLTLTGCPQNVTCNLSSSSCTPSPPSDQCQSTLTMTANQSALAGSSTITVTGRAGTQTKTTSFNLSVQDDIPPTAAITTSFAGCYTPSNWVNIQPITAQASDNVGVTSVTFKVTNTGDTSKFRDFPGFFNLTTNSWQRIITIDDLTAVGGTGPTGGGQTYKLEVLAKDGSNNTSASSTPATFNYKDSCADITPWIQTTGGDVHANVQIRTPGGP